MKCWIPDSNFTQGCMERHATDNSDPRDSTKWECHRHPHRHECNLKTCHVSLCRICPMPTTVRWQPCQQPLLSRGSSHKLVRWGLWVACPPEADSREGAPHLHAHGERHYMGGGIGYFLDVCLGAWEMRAPTGRGSYWGEGHFSGVTGPTSPVCA